MAQRKHHSLLETCISTAIGFVISYGLNMIVLPGVFDIHPTHTQNVIATCIFTVASLSRGYVVRRLFNWLHIKGIL